MRFLLPMKRDIRVLPPLLSVVRGLSRLGHEATVFGYYNSPVAVTAVRSPGVSMEQLSATPYPRDFLRRLWATARCAVGLWRQLRTSPGYDYVWLSGADYPTLDLLRRLAGSKTPLVYHSHEYNQGGFRYCRLARWTVVPEENRAWITRFNAGLRNRPFVLPNIPFDHPRTSDPSADCGDIEALRHSGRRIVLYPGDPDLERRCLREMIQAIAATPPSVVLAIMPARLDALTRERIEAEAREHGVAQRVSFLATRTPPEHLQVIARADIGIGLYRATSLNQVYCAPNRLYEFCGFGIPVVLPAYPAMRQLEDRYGCVATCDPESPASIAEAISRLAEPGAAARAAEGARRFYDQEANYLDKLDAFCGLLEADLRATRSSGAAPTTPRM